MNSRENRWLAIGVAIMLFGGADLVALVLTPGPQRGWVMVPPVVAAFATLVVLPFVLGRIQQQYDRIRLQQREIETRHAMDTAIVAEAEIDRVLETASRQVMRAVNAEAGGVVLFAADNGAEPSAETVVVLERDGADKEKFAEVLRTGGRPCRQWQALIAPVKSADGEHGFLAAARYRPTHPFDDDDQEQIQALATTVGVAVANARRLESARRAAEVRAEAERVFADLERERRVAQALTEELLPDVPPRIGPWGLSRRYVPQSTEANVGGDIYDLFPLPGGRLAVLIADVSGKGLAAARQTAMVKYSLRSYAREHESPARVLERLNDAVTDDPTLTGFVTLLYAVLEESTGKMTYASAGHEPPLIRRADGTLETLPPTGMVLGAMRDMPYEDGGTTLAPGDGLLLYTDGLSEARNREAGEFLTLDGIQRMVTDLAGCPPEKVADCLLAKVAEYTGGRRSDDTAIVWVERMPPESPEDAAA